MNTFVPADSRLEIKFSAYEIQLHKLLQWIRIHPAVFSIPFPDRWVNNIYFDTHNYNAIIENMSGASSRKKVRYRWYGESVGPDTGTLEVKCKRNYFGWKYRYTVSTPPYKPGYSWNHIRQALLEQLPFEGKNLIYSKPFPIMINRYHRKYFLSADKKIRITIDTKQAVWDQRFKSFPNFDLAGNLPNTLVVEFKFYRTDRDIASTVLQGMPLRVSKHSKYINGVMAFYG